MLDSAERLRKAAEAARQQRGVTAFGKPRRSCSAAPLPVPNLREILAVLVGVLLARSILSVTKDNRLVVFVTADLNLKTSMTRKR